MTKMALSCFILCVTLASCCKKGPLKIPNFHILYPQLDQYTVITATILYANDSIQMSETILFEKSEVDFEMGLSTGADVSKQIIDVYSPTVDSVQGVLLYSDTISDVYLEYGGRCKQDIEEFNYLHNGIFKTENTIAL